MKANPDCISDTIRELQQQLNQLLTDHGHIHLDRPTSAVLIYNIGRISEYVGKLENAWSQAEWNRRAACDRLELLKQMTSASAEVLGLMRPDDESKCVIVPFPARPTTPQPPSPPGGTAA